MPLQDADPARALSCPRTKVGDRLGRFIVNRLRVRVRLDERRIGEILAGVDTATMGPSFVSTAGRLLGHLGDVMTLGFTPMAPMGEGGGVGGAGGRLSGWECACDGVVAQLTSDCSGEVFVCVLLCIPVPARCAPTLRRDCHGRAPQPVPAAV